MEVKPLGLIEVARTRIRARHYSLRTEKAYVFWMRRFIRFNGRRHPREMGAPEVEAFLTHLAVDAKVSSSTQNQALAAILFLYRDVLELSLPWLGSVVRAKPSAHLPVVLTREEVARVLAHLPETPRLVASLLYGSGARLMECLRLRVKDLELVRGEILIRDGKGAKDRVTVLPAALIPTLEAHLSRVRHLFDADREAGRPGVTLPDAIARKYPFPHETWYQNSGYFTFYGYDYATRLLPALEPAQRAEHAASIASYLAPLQEPDGSWWDYQLYGYHKPYGTAMVLAALGRCR